MSDWPGVEIERLERGELSIGVAPALGGGVVWMRSEGGGEASGEAWRWLREPAAGSAPTGRDLGCFVLTPFSNRIIGARFEIGGREILLPRNFPPEPHMIHGVGWTSPWTLIERTPSSIALSLDWKSVGWPWIFEARLSYALTETGVSMTLTQRNDDETPMPSGLGFHPYFLRTEDVRLKLDAAAMVLSAEDMTPTRLDAEAPALAELRAGAPLPGGLDNGFYGWRGAAEIRWPAAGRALRITAEPQSEFAVVYTPEAKPYFCVEPVTHQTDAHNRRLEGVADTGLILLEPGQSQSLTMRLEPIAP